MPAAVVRVDRTAFNRKVRRLQTAATEVGRSTLIELGSDARDYMLTISPRDTGRYARGWEIAGNLAGLRLRAVSGVKQSKYSAENRDRIDQQHKKWLRIVAAHEIDRPERDDKWTRAAKKNLERAAEELERIDAAPDLAIVIGGKATKNQGLSSLARVITTLYGGEGRVYRVGNTWMLELKNREPHARIVEWGSAQKKPDHVVARTVSKAKVDGLTKVRRNAVLKMQFLAPGMRPK